MTSSEKTGVWTGVRATILEVDRQVVARSDVVGWPLLRVQDANPRDLELTRAEASLGGPCRVGSAESLFGVVLGHERRCTFAFEDAVPQPVGAIAESLDGTERHG